jgi:CheY-like chemotaxis protein
MPGAELHWKGACPRVGDLRRHIVGIDRHQPSATDGSGHGSAVRVARRGRHLRWSGSWGVRLAALASPAASGGEDKEPEYDRGAHEEQTRDGIPSSPTDSIIAPARALVFRACPELLKHPGEPGGRLWDDPAVRRTLLIVDDHAPFRALARALLEAEGFAVVGEAHDGASALAAASELRPDVVLLDVYLPDGTGWDVAPGISEAGGGSAVVLTSSRDVSSFGQRLSSSGARGFIAKDELSGTALHALTA